MHWFEANLQKLLIEAGQEGLRMNIIVRNVCNLEPSLFGVLHPYDEAYKEIQTFLHRESKKRHSPYRHATLSPKGKKKIGYYFYDKTKEKANLQIKLDF